MFVRERTMASAWLTCTAAVSQTTRYSSRHRRLVIIITKRNRRCYKRATKTCSLSNTTPSCAGLRRNSTYLRPYRAASLPRKLADNAWRVEFPRRPTLQRYLTPWTRWLPDNKASSIDYDRLLAAAAPHTALFHFWRQRPCCIDRVGTCRNAVTLVMGHCIHFKNSIRYMRYYSALKS